MLIDKPAQRQRAVLLTASALAAEETDRDRARALVLDAVKLVPTLVPAAELAGRLLAEARKLRKAGKIIEKAWTANPHPDLAQVFAYLRFGDTARDRLARVRSLAEKAPGHVESAIAVARAAIDAQEFAVARNALKPLLAEPTQRVAELMAELEHADTGNEGRAREWMARALRAPRDPAWTADGFVSDRWLPVSPVSGRLDALQWKVPPALGHHHEDALIDDDGARGSARLIASRRLRSCEEPVTVPRRRRLNHGSPQLALSWRTKERTKGGARIPLCTRRTIPARIAAETESPRTRADLVAYTTVQVICAMAC